MCGIAGFIDFSRSTNRSDLLAMATAMAGALRHRGPDAAGAWADEQTGVGLGHARLSIIDLSEAGAQPMISHSGRFVAVFNGEIYNHAEVRLELEGSDSGPAIAWRGHSDTEIMLAAFDRFGIEAAIKRLAGMFALAVLDTHEQVFHLLRDRMGEKPLYWCLDNGLFLFGSELKALHAHPGFAPRIAPAALGGFLRYNYVPAPLSIYDKVYKLEPGHMLSVDISGKEVSGPRPYWSLAEAVARGSRSPFTGGEDQAVEELERLLVRVVAGQMVADVPLGCFLSGGIDSSLVVALMKAANTGPVKTFTIGFSDRRFNEAEDARLVAEHLGCEHTELYASPDDALALVDDLPRIYDEPFADSSQLPTCLVSRLTREHVTVALSGDGGDEMFAGYNRHSWTPGLMRRFAFLPLPLRRIVAGAVLGVPQSSWERLHGAVSGVLPERFRPRLAGDKIHKTASVMASRDLAEAYAALVANWPDPAAVMAVSSGEVQARSLLHDPPGNLDPVAWMQYLDAATYLPDDIMAKVDRASMAYSLETRAPYLDHRVVEFAFSLPTDMKIRDGQGKWIMRRILHRHVPRELVERPKMGFGVPVGEWLRGPLRGWAEALLEPGRLRREGFFRPEVVGRFWSEHVSGRHDHVYKLWCVLMFQSWLEAWGKGGAGA